MTHLQMEIGAAIAVFALAGGWCAAQAIRIFSLRPFRTLWAVPICGLLALWAWRETGWTEIFPITLFLGWMLFVLAAVDAAVFRLPDLLTLPLAAGGIIVVLFLPHLHTLPHLIGAVAGFSIFVAIAWSYAKLRRREGLGFGDAKLAGAAGAWLGWEPLPSVILIACAAGLLWVGVGAILRGRAALKERVPFGVALALAIWIVWLYGPMQIFSDT